MPFVGEPSDEYRAVCAFAPRPGQPKCTAPATVHIKVSSDEWGVVALASCGRHAPIARASGTFHQEHPHAGYCGLPATLWAEVENRCVLDDSGQEREPAYAAEQTGDGNG